MNWHWKKKRAFTPVKVEVIRKDVVRLQLSDWQKDPTLVSAGQKLLGDETMRVVVQVLKNEHPGHVVLPKNFPSDLRAHHQSQCEGYTLCLANLEAMATLKQLAEIGEPTFESEEQPTRE